MIEGCGSFRPAVEQLINQALATIPPAIRDANTHGTRSLYGFKAMFKTDNAVPAVTTMLQKVAALTALPGLLPYPQYPQKPRFACATLESVHTYPFIPFDPLITCEIGRVAAFSVSSTAYIFLCPVFWRLPSHPEEPPLTGLCPEVKNNAFIVYPGSEVYNFQSYIIIHEIVHFYLQSMSLSGLTHPPEQYTLNGCVSLDPLTSLLNPLNIQTYVSSKYTVS